VDDRLKLARNVGILLLLAAVVAYLPGGARAANTFATILAAVFGVALAFGALRLYLSRRVDLYSLGDNRRALLYGALGVGVVTLAAKVRLWATGFGELVWFVLLALVVYTLFALYRYSRTY
jgi:FtsH-binding integral membrane protein